MYCPSCKTSGMTAVALDPGLEARHCDSCGGHWLTQKDYAKWVEAQPATGLDANVPEPKLDVEDSTKAKVCPECRCILVKYEIGHGLKFFIEHCPGCGGVWLDKNEWQAIRGKKLHRQIHMVFSDAWQLQARKERTREKLEAMYVSRFGQETYDRLKGIRDWIQAHPQRRALLAFLDDNDPFRIDVAGPAGR